MVYMIHACGSHARKHWKDFEEVPWKLTHKWQYVAVPKQEWRETGKKAVSIARCIIANNKNGKFEYSQSNKRWNGWKNLNSWMQKHNCNIYEAIRDCDSKDLQFDCSSFVLSMWWFADPNVYKGTWRTYTGGMRTVLRNSKAFDIYTAKDATQTPTLACDGALYWKENAHTVMAALEPSAEPIPEPDDEPDDPLPDTEQTYFRVVGGTLRIRKGPGTLYKTVGFTNETERYPLLDVTKNNWFETEYNGQPSYVSGNTKYTEVVNGD